MAISYHLRATFAQNICVHVLAPDYNHTTIKDPMKFHTVCDQEKGRVVALNRVRKGDINLCGFLCLSVHNLKQADTGKETNQLLLYLPIWCSLFQIIQSPTCPFMK